MLTTLHRYRIAMTGGFLTLTFLTSCGGHPPDSSRLQSEATGQPAAMAPSATAAPPATTDAPPAPANWTVVDAPHPLTQEELWQRLQQPGDSLYVVLLRHALAPGTGDPANFQLDDCSTQRNLSEAGREQARQIGQAFRDRGVAVQQVLSSQWCRCLETAELMDLGPVEPYPALNSFFRDRRTAEAQTTETKQFLLAQADSLGVMVMVTHQVNITGITGIVPRSGEAVVVQVTETGLTQVGQVMPAS